MTRLSRAVAGLDPDQRLAGVAALALLATLLLPWYEKSLFVRGVAVDDSVSAFGAFSFVEAAVLLVAAGVLVLLLARGERRAFHLPGGDGAVVAAAGAWAAALLLWRVFDRPDVEGAGATIGITWGFFFAFLAAAALGAAGARMTAAGGPEPPYPGSGAVSAADWVEPPPAPPRRRHASRLPVERVDFERPPAPDEPPELPRRRR